MPNIAARVFQTNAHFDSYENSDQCASLAYVVIFCLVSIVLQHFPHRSIQNNQENLTYKIQTLVSHHGPDVFASTNGIWQEKSLTAWQFSCELTVV